MTPTDANREAVEVVRLALQTVWDETPSLPPLTFMRSEADALIAATTAHLTAERDAALRECIKWAREAGEAKGTLEGRDGILELREKCEALEAERDALRERCERLEAALRNELVALASEDRHGG